MVFTNATPFPLTITPLTNITPFTYRDGETYLSILEKMRVWLNDVLVPEFNAGIDNAIASMNAAEDAWQTGFDSYMSDVDASLLALNKPALITLLSDQDVKNALRAKQITGPVGTAPPSAYPLGYTYFRTTDGVWPSLSGTVTTLRDSSLRTFQTYAAKSAGRIHTRVETDGDTWTPWTESATTELATPTTPGLMSAADKAKLNAL